MRSLQGMYVVLQGTHNYAPYVCTRIQRQLMTSPLRRALSIVLLCAVVVSLGVATGATVLSGPADTLADDRVAIQPVEDTPYAFLDDDDELVIDVTGAAFDDAEGVNTNAVTGFSEVFEITYTADEFAEVWIETENDSAVTFTANGDSFETESNNVTLGPNETVAVGFSIDTRDATALPADIHEEDFSVHANVKEPEADADSESDDAGADDVGGSDDSDDGSSTTVEGTGDERSVSVANLDGGETAVVDLGGMELDGANVSLDRLDLTSSGGGSYELDIHGTPEPIDGAGALETADGAKPHAYLALDYEFDPTAVEELTLGVSADYAYLDEREVDANDLVVFRLTDDGEWDALDGDLIEPADAGERDLPDDRAHLEATAEGLSVFAVASHVPVASVTDATVEDTTIDVEQETAVTATVENNGGAAGNDTLALEANGTVIDTTAVTLSTDEPTEVRLPVAFDEPGVYDLSVNGTAAGTVTVEEPPVDGEASLPEVDLDLGDGEDPAEAAAPDEPVEEPAGFGVAEFGGLSALLLVIVFLLVLVRRAPTGER